MYEYPVLFPAISNQETWLQIIQICDDQTGDPIALTDSSGTPLYQIYCEIAPPRDGRGGCSGGYGEFGWYGGGFGDGRIHASLADYITIPDVGTIQIQIPYKIMETLRGATRTYDVYLRLVDEPNGDARQLLIGKLPVAYAGHGHGSSARGTIP
jgi:hypothetical protein